HAHHLLHSFPTRRSSDLTGERERKREIGSAVSTVQPQEHQLASAQNVSQLLTGKIPGVDVAQAGGTIGSASRTRIRGANSLSLTDRKSTRLNSSHDQISY